MYHNERTNEKEPFKCRASTRSRRMHGTFLQWLVICLLRSEAFICSTLGCRCPGVLSGLSSNYFTSCLKGLKVLKVLEQGYVERGQSIKGEMTPWVCMRQNSCCVTCHSPYMCVTPPKNPTFVVLHKSVKFTVFSLGSFPLYSIYPYNACSLFGWRMLWYTFELNDILI